MVFYCGLLDQFEAEYAVETKSRERRGFLAPYRYTTKIGSLRVPSWRIVQDLEKRLACASIVRP